MGFMDELKKLAKPYADDDDDFDEFDEGTAAPARNTSRAAEQDEPAQNTGRRTAGAAAAGADRNKVVNGVRKACQGRPIDEDQLKMLGQRVEEDLRSRGLATVKSDEVGKAILKPLRDLDEVAYMRFASVYHNFENLQDFQHAIDELNASKAKELNGVH